jgi:hypothetical protein
MYVYKYTKYTLLLNRSLYVQEPHLKTLFDSPPQGGGGESVPQRLFLTGVATVLDLPEKSALGKGPKRRAQVLFSAGPAEAAD